MRILFVLVGVSMLSACSSVPYGCRSYDNCTPTGLYAPSFYPMGQQDSMRMLYADDPENHPEAVFARYHDAQKQNQ